VAGEEEQKKGEGKGFAGLSSLVSDVDTTPPPAAKKEPPAAAPSAGRPASQPAQPQPQPSQRQTYQEPAQQSSGPSSGKWVLGIAAVIGVLWLIGQSNKNTTSPAPAYTPPAQSTAPSYSPPVQPQVPSRPQESKPPVGQDLVFSSAQIRYCLAEDIRMDGAKSAVDNYIDSDVDRFNAMVADYNSRCGSFRYRSGALESARRDVEPYRSQLQAEGRSRFARSPSTGSLSAPAPARPASDATVQAIQRKLNELGYEAGTADGLMGRGTRSAILAFQRDNGLVADGNPTAALLQLLTESRQVERQEESQPTQPPAPSVAAAPPTYTPPARAPTRQESTSVSSTEQAAIERACDSARRYSGPAVYQSCLNRELASLSSSGGRPDLSRATETERNAIERACDSARQYSGQIGRASCRERVS
jgi:peptidoglycan hydrolase-like protein with peptidoglycan-binding domain